MSDPGRNEIEVVIECVLRRLSCARSPILINELSRVLDRLLESKNMDKDGNEYKNMDKDWNE